MNFYKLLCFQSPLTGQVFQISLQVDSLLLPHVFCQDDSLLPVGGQPGGNAATAGHDWPHERHDEVAPEPPERQYGEEGDVRPRHRTLLQRGGLCADGEGHEDSGHPAG